MKFSRAQRRRHSASRPATAFAASAVEALERKQLLSATNGTEDSQTDVDSALQAYRDEVLANTIQLADSEYGDLWGTETVRIWYWEYDAIARTANGIEAQAVSDSNTKVSDTNVQVAGVDEADIVETDGTFIYTLSGSELVIVRAASADDPAEVISRVSLDSQPQSMFLTEGRLTIISTTNSWTPVEAVSLRISGTHAPQTRLTVFDISDTSTPTVIDETIVDGTFDSARAVDNNVYLVVRNHSLPSLPDLNIVAQNQPDGDSIGQSLWRYETREEFITRITELNEERFPASIYQRANPDGPDQSLTRLGWLDSLNSEVSVAPESLVSVLKFDLQHLEAGPNDAFSYRSSNFGQSTTYATADALYITTTQYDWSNRLRFNPADVIAPMAGPSTVIHKIDLTGESLQLAATGTVPGSVESQFSLDEHNGYLRVVTTTGNGWGDNDFANHLFVLEDAGDDLVEVGSLRDLAPTERIYAARFDGDRGWMVTFRQVDPVFSFDLSDPTNPVVTGELKIPGYSDYLQMIDDDHLLAIGRNATDEGRVQGLQVSLFNIADPQNPTLLHRYDFDNEGWGNSEALNNHLAFNYFSEDGILAIPYQTYGEFQLVLLNVDHVEGISLAGDIGASESPDEPWKLDYSNRVRRTVQIGDRLYAMSDQQIHVIHLDSPDDVEATVNLQDDQDRPWDLHDLPWHFENPFAGELRLREIVEPNVDPQLLVSVVTDITDFSSDISQFEFRLLDPETGEELARQVSNQPELTLDQLPELESMNRVQVQARVLRERLANSDFSRWSEPVTVGLSTAGDILSETAQQVDVAKLEWAAIRDRIESGTDNEGARNLEQLLESYEVWVSDADLMQRIALHTDLTDTSLPLNLAPGNYFTWVRGVFADGTKGEWSARQELQIQAKAPRLLNEAIATAANRIDLNWTATGDLALFEVQVTSPDGTETVLTVNNLNETSLQLIDELEPGTYSVRVRGFTSDDRASAWSDPTNITIVGRPEISLDGNSATWAADAAEQFEVWVSDSNNERIYFTSSWKDAEVTNIFEDLHLKNRPAGQFKMWVRATMPDGSQTAWSAPTIISHGIPEHVVLETASQFGLSQLPVIQWQQSDAIESYEVFIKRAGETGAFLRQNGLTDTVFQMAEQLPEGDYQVWVRGALTGGGLTNWGQAHHFSVSDTPVLTIVNNVASWTSDLDASRYELWVNRYDELGELLEARALHDQEIVDSSFDLGTLEDGNYGVWIRSVLNDGEDEIKSAWSNRTNVVIERGTDLLDNLGDSVNNIIDDIIGDLNLF